MQTTAIRTVTNSLPENEVILLTLLISKRYIPYTDLHKKVETTHICCGFLQKMSGSLRRQAPDISTIYSITIPIFLCRAYAFRPVPEGCKGQAWTPSFPWSDAFLSVVAYPPFRPRPPLTGGRKGVKAASAGRRHRVPR